MEDIAINTAVLKALVDTLNAKDYNDNFIIKNSRQIIGMFKGFIEEDLKIIDNTKPVKFEHYIKKLFYQAGLELRVNINGEDLLRLLRENKALRYPVDQWRKKNDTLSPDVLTSYLDAYHAFKSRLTEHLKRARNNAIKIHAKPRRSQATDDYNG